MDQDLQPFVMQRMEKLIEGDTSTGTTISGTVFNSSPLQNIFDLDSLDRSPSFVRANLALRNLPIGVGKLTINLGDPLLQLAIAMAKGGFDAYADSLPATDTVTIGANSLLLGSEAVFASSESDFLSETDSRYYRLTDLFSVSGHAELDNAANLKFAYRDLYVQGGPLQRDSSGVSRVSFDFSERETLYFFQADLEPFLSSLRTDLNIHFPLFPESLGGHVAFTAKSGDAATPSDGAIWEQLDLGSFLGMGELRLLVKATYLSLPRVWQSHVMVWNAYGYAESVQYHEPFYFGMAHVGVNWLGLLVLTDTDFIDRQEWPVFMGSSVAYNNGTPFGYSSGQGSWTVYPIDLQYIFDFGLDTMGLVAAYGRFGFGTEYGYTGSSQPKFLAELGLSYLMK